MLHSPSPCAHRTPHDAPSPPLHADRRHGTGLPEGPPCPPAKPRRQTRAGRRILAHGSRPLHRQRRGSRLLHVRPPELPEQASGLLSPFERPVPSSPLTSSRLPRNGFVQHDVCPEAIAAIACLRVNAYWLDREHPKGVKLGHIWVFVGAEDG